MKFESKSHWSGQLGREMNLNVYGHSGKPVIVFPSSGGSHHEYGNFGMIDAIGDFIERGLIKVYTPDSIDKESWLATHKSAYDKVQAHDAYDRYIVHELVPLIRHECAWHKAMLATGCSMGGFHAVNFALRHPDLFDVVIALSGVYDARFFTHEHHDNHAAYFNSPIDYVAQQNDDWFLSRYHQNHYIIAVGQGAWETQHIADTRRLQAVFAQKGIVAWFDYWGHDMPHDWTTWRQQMPYFLKQLEMQKII